MPALGDDSMAAARRAARRGPACWQCLPIRGAASKAPASKPAPVVAQLAPGAHGPPADLERGGSRRRVPCDVGDGFLEEQEQVATRLRIELDALEIGRRRIRPSHARAGERVVGILANAPADARQIVPARVDGPDDVTERIEELSRTVGDLHDTPCRLLARVPPPRGTRLRSGWRCATGCRRCRRADRRRFASVRAPARAGARPGTCGPPRRSAGPP